VEEQDGDATLVFLGDLVDRGDDQLEVVLRILELVAKRPGKVALLAGNHDVALDFVEASAEAPMTTRVHPGEFPDWFNQQQRNAPGLRDFGSALVKFLQDLPRAIALPNGVYAAHGGFPHSDLWPRLGTVDDLEDIACLNDCTWNRLADAPRKQPNRYANGCSFGVQDFFGFSDSLERLTGRRVERMVRGHDHVTGKAARWQCDGKRWGYRALTINTLCTNAHESPYLGPRHRQPAMARMTPSGELEIVVVEIPSYLVDELYPLPPPSPIGGSGLQ
jgi:hypothetical protein